MYNELYGAGGDSAPFCLSVNSGVPSFIMGVLPSSNLPGDARQSVEHLTVFVGGPLCPDNCHNLQGVCRCPFYFIHCLKFPDISWESCELKAGGSSNKLKLIPPSQEGELPGKTENPTPQSGASYCHGSSGMGLHVPPKPGVALDVYLSPQTLGTFLTFPILFPGLLSHAFIKRTTRAPASH